MPSGRSLRVCRRKCSAGSPISVVHVTYFLLLRSIYAAQALEEGRCLIEPARQLSATPTRPTPRIEPRDASPGQTKPLRPARGSHDSHQSEALTAGPTALKKLRGRRADARVWSARWSIMMRPLLAAALAARAASLMRAAPKPQSVAADAPWWEPGAEKEHETPWEDHAYDEHKSYASGPWAVVALAALGVLAAVYVDADNEPLPPVKRRR